MSSGQRSERRRGVVPGEQMCYRRWENISISHWKPQGCRHTHTQRTDSIRYKVWFEVTLDSCVCVFFGNMKGVTWSSAGLSCQNGHTSLTCERGRQEWVCVCMCICTSMRVCVCVYWQFGWPSAFFNGLDRVTATIARSHASFHSLLQHVQKKNDLQLLSMFFVVTALFGV